MAKLPKIPQKNSYQFIALQALITSANDPFLKHVWLIRAEGLTHDQFVNAISKLREEKGWPIEDTAECDGQNGYRMDKERWASIKNKITI